MWRLRERRENLEMGRHEAKQNNFCVFFPFWVYCFFINWNLCVIFNIKLIKTLFLFLFFPLLVLKVSFSEYIILPHIVCAREGEKESERLLRQRKPLKVKWIFLYKILMNFIFYSNNNKQNKMSEGKFYTTK